MTPLDTVATQLARLSGLGEEPRRALYVYVLGQTHPVSRDEAAAGVRVSRPLAAYHLDKLSDAGLLDVTFERRSGRRGPGAGRPSKLYSRAAEPVELSVPTRDYAFLADLLAQSIESPQDSPRDALLEIARRTGQTARDSTAAQSAQSDRVTVMQLLSEHGYEPYEDGPATVRFRNCPFHRLAEGHRELVCGANLAFVEGLLGPLRSTGMTASLEPGPDECCVAVRGV